MATFMVTSAAFTGDSSDTVRAALWNPVSPPRRLKVYRAWYVEYDSDASVTVRVYLARITARGTAGATTTPDDDHSLEDDAGPDSGALLDVGPYSVNPTLGTSAEMVGGPLLVQATTSTPGLWQVELPGVVIPPGTGLAFATLGTSNMGGVHLAGFEFED